MNQLPKSLILLLIEVSDAFRMERVTDMPNSTLETRRIGDNWVSRAEAPVLEVLSVIAPRQKNYLLNPRHPDFASGVRILDHDDPFVFDVRLISAVSAPNA